MTLKFNSTSDHARSSASPTTLSPLPPLIFYMYTTLAMAMATLLGTPNVSRSGRTCCYPDSNGVTYPSSNNPSKNFRFSQTQRWSPSFGIPDDMTDGKTDSWKCSLIQLWNCKGNLCPAWKKVQKIPMKSRCKTFRKSMASAGSRVDPGSIDQLLEKRVVSERVGKSSVKPSILGRIFEMSKFWQPSPGPPINLL